MAVVMAAPLAKASASPANKAARFYRIKRAKGMTCGRWCQNKVRAEQQPLLFVPDPEIHIVAQAPRRRIEVADISPDEGSVVVFQVAERRIPYRCFRQQRSGAMRSLAAVM